MNNRPSQHPHVSASPWSRITLSLHLRIPWLDWITGLGYIFLYAPILILVVFSFNNSRFNVVWRGFTLDWYIKLFEDTKILEALKVSLIVALASTAISLVIGTLTAWAMYRYSFKGKRIFEGLLYLPIIIPDIVMGISLTLFFVLIKFRLGMASIIIAHVAFNISFVMVVVRARLQGLDRTLEEAAMDLGADEVTTFFKVTLPLLSPGLIAAALLAFTLSFDDFVISFFTAGVGATPLPVQIYSMVKLGVSPVVNAISTLVLIVSFILVALAEKLRRE
jgi:spermidine/putrescine transport system permease protein